MVTEYFLLFSEKPKIHLDGIRGGKIKLRAGEPLLADIPISGAPKPTIEWKKNGKKITPTSRLNVSRNKYIYNEFYMNDKVGLKFIYHNVFLQIFYVGFASMSCYMEVYFSLLLFCYLLAYCCQNLNTGSDLKFRR